MAARRRVSARVVLPHDMVREILTWLPTKSLMRLKLVSSLWLSSILDPSLARQHRVPFRGLLVMNPDPSIYPGGRGPTKNFFFANFDGREGESNNNLGEVNLSFQFSVPDDIRSFQISNVVNGIVCFYNRNLSKLFNIATRELISLPESKYTYRTCYYHLGFDSIQHVYKLVKICPKLKKMGSSLIVARLKSEILTIGVDSSWRSIMDPPARLVPQGLCVDGVLYWVIPRSMAQVFIPSGEPDPLYSFDLASEKFQSIQHPLLRPKLVDFGTSVALTGCTLFREEFSLPPITITHYRKGSWGEIYDYYPNSSPVFQDRNENDRFNPRRLVEVRGLLPNGNLMVYHYTGITSGGPIYVFDPRRNYLEKFIAKFPDSHSDSIGGRISWFEENIITLKAFDRMKD